MAEPSQADVERWEWCRKMQSKVEVKCMMCGETFTTTEGELANAEGELATADGFFADCHCCGGIVIRAERFKVLDIGKFLLCKRVCVQVASDLSGLPEWMYRGI